jgi:hypothetical protein
VLTAPLLRLLPLPALLLMLAALTAAAPFPGPCALPFMLRAPARALVACRTVTSWLSTRRSREVALEELLEDEGPACA